MSNPLLRTAFRPCRYERTLAAAMTFIVGACQAVAGGPPDPFSFSAPINISFEGTQFPSHVAAADLDEDGNVDVVVSGRNSEGLVQLLFGNGNGTFAAPQPLLIGTQTDWIEIDDFDGDDNLDLACAIRSSTGRVAIVWGNGDGTFEEQIDEYIVGRTTQSLVVTDLNGDDHPDLVAGNFNSGTIRALINDGTGAFSIQPPIFINPYVAGTIGVNHIEAGDLNDDGASDLIVTTLGGGRINVLFGNGDGTFRRETGYRLPVIDEAIFGAAMVSVGDVSGDGQPDIVAPMTSNMALEKFGVFENPGDGVFDPPEVFPGPTSQYVWSCALADFDGDERLDVAFGVALGVQIALVRNLSADTLAFSPPQTLSSPGLFPKFILPVDLNDDGAPDLVVADVVENFVQVRMNLTPQGEGALLADRDTGGAPPSRIEPEPQRIPSMIGRPIHEVLLELERMGGEE